MHDELTNKKMPRCTASTIKTPQRVLWENSTRLKVKNDKDHIPNDSIGITSENFRKEPCKMPPARPPPPSHPLSSADSPFFSTTRHILNSLPQHPSPAIWSPSPQPAAHPEPPLLLPEAPISLRRVPSSERLLSLTPTSQVTGLSPKPIFKEGGFKRDL
jgi:hypothetical protein